MKRTMRTTLWRSRRLSRGIFTRLFSALLLLAVISGCDSNSVNEPELDACEKKPALAECTVTLPSANAEFEFSPHVEYELNGLILEPVITIQAHAKENLSIERLFVSSREDASRSRMLANNTSFEEDQDYMLGEDAPMKVIEFGGALILEVDYRLESDSTNELRQKTFGLTLPADTSPNLNIAIDAQVKTKRLIEESGKPELQEIRLELISNHTVYIKPTVRAQNRKDRELPGRAIRKDLPHLVYRYSIGGNSEAAGEIEYTFVYRTIGGETREQTESLYY